MVQTYLVKMDDMEVRKVARKEVEINDKVYTKLEVHFDTLEGDRVVLYDKDMSHEETYKRGDVGTITIRVTTDNTTKTSKNGNAYIAEKTTITIERFELS